MDGNDADLKAMLQMREREMERDMERERYADEKGGSTSGPPLRLLSLGTLLRAINFYQEFRLIWRMFSTDGGGVKGYSELLLLQEVHS